MTDNRRSNKSIIERHSCHKRRGTNTPIVQIEHPVQDYNAWKKAFDTDPLSRKKSGVRRYRILRRTDNPNYVMIDLEFDSLSQAEAFQVALRKMWSHVEGQIMKNPQARIVEAVESKEY